MKRTNHRDISSFFHKKIQKDIGSVSSPNLSISKASLQASSPSNNGSSDEHGEAQDIPQNQEKHVEVTSVHMDEVLIDNGRLRKNRRFNPNLFQKHESWLEYSVEKDATFYFVCYLFKDDNTAGGDAFVGSGFRAWNRTDAFVKHVGGHMSAHNQALGRLNDFKNQKTSISSAPSIQKDIINACAKETTKAIIEELDDGLFSILADESADISDKEQMSLCLRYVNRKGEVQERFLGILQLNHCLWNTL
ncbi:hypothetical protein V6N13_006199 [Hibiscus sabdariffa]